MRVVERRWSAPLRLSSSACFLTKFISSDSSRLATVVKASSIKEIRFGKASLKKPLILTVTSTLGRPSSSNGTTSSPVTRLDSSFQTGLTPSSARISATSSPWVLIAAVPHTTMPTVSG